MNRIGTLLPVVASALILSACGGGNTTTSGDATPESTSTPEATATATPEVVSEPTPRPGKCDEVKYRPGESSEFTHPDSNFYAPDATSLPTKADLDHLLVADNAVVVTYAADTKKNARERLYDWTYADVTKRTPVVVPDDAADALPVRARIATVELRCNGFDWKRLTKFANRTDIAPLPRTG
jgi:hypothetical protein